VARGGGVTTVTEPGAVWALVHRGGGAAATPGGGLVPVMATTPYVELLFGAIGGRRQLGILEYRGGRRRRGTNGGVVRW
jgi:hypothetical protein